MDCCGFRMIHKVSINTFPKYESVREIYYDDPADAHRAKEYFESRLRVFGLDEHYEVYWEQIVVEKKFELEVLDDMLRLPKGD